MGMNNIIRRVSTASKAIPLAIRVAGGGSQRYPCYCSASMPPAHRSSDVCGGNLLKRSFPSGLHRYSSLAAKDESLIRVLQQEIECAKETENVDKVDQVPEGFPFKLKDNPGKNTVTLSREYHGEKIVVEVYMPSIVTREEEEEEDGQGGERDVNEDGTSSQLPLVVSVSRNKGPSLEFGCTAYPDEISIDSLSLKDPDNSLDPLAYEGPDFVDLDENLQKAFHKYLEIRGIKPSITNYLHEYMINKDSREYLLWLNNIKQFIEN